MGEDRIVTLIDRLTSVPMLIFYLVVAAAGFHWLDPSTLHKVAADVRNLFPTVKP